MQREVDGLLSYVPGLLRDWTPSGYDDRHMRVAGTLAFVDISGFTRLTERLARRGKVGAEEMSDLLSGTFAGLLAEAQEDGADLVKWGGDAMLLLFQGDGHPERAARSAHRMRARLRVVGRLPTTSGTVNLRMSVGVHSGEFDFFLVGDPDLHRELVLSGPSATLTAATEAAAPAGQIGLSAATAALLAPRVLGPALHDGRLLRSAPPRTVPPVVTVGAGGPGPAEVLSAPLRAHLLQGAVEPEHRLVTVAFVQFSGSDQLLASAGPGPLAEALDELVRNVQHACDDHDVTFLESDVNVGGGKIVLLAGAPVSADRDEERMLRVARVVLDRAGRLPLRIGVNRGHVFAGDFGPVFRRTYSVKGDAVNLAARLAAAAVPGRALAAADVVARSQTTFRTAELPPFTVKGRRQPVTGAVEVGAQVGSRSEQRPTGPLVGREAELATLLDALAQARAGRGQVVEIVGAAGLGKSRLLTELLTDPDEVAVVRVRCEQYESSTPYFPLRRLLRDVLGVAADASPDDVAAHLTGRVAAVAPHLLPWVPLLGVPLDVPLPPTRETAELDERFRKRRLEVVVTELLRAVLTDPTVLVLEDADAADDASVDLLRRFTARLADRPVLFLVTKREPGSGFVPPPGAAITLRLQPLDPGVALELVRATMGEHPLPPQAASSLVGRAGGNPLFLEALVREAGRADSLDQLPQSVEALVTSQMDRLDPADRTVVRYAAVFGTVVDEPTLDLLLAAHDAEVPAGALGRLADFLVRDPQGRLRFRNALSRDVAYEGLPFSRRKTLHDHVGRAIEEASTRPESQCELLSLHFFHAGRHDRAWRYSVLAGERAVAKFAHGQAVEFFGRAAQATPYHAVVGDLEVARVLEQLADSRFLLGLSEPAEQAYAAARRHLRGDPVRLAGIIEKEARIDHRRRKYTQAMRRISRGLNGLEGVPGTPAAVARSLLARRYAYSRFNQGRIDEALHWAGVAAHEAEEAVDNDALAQAYEMLNAIHAGSGREEDLPYGRLALQAYRELGNLPRQGHCLNNLAVAAFTHGRWNEALTSYEQATDIFRRIGDTASEGNAIYNHAELLVCQRRYDEAAALLPEVLRIARALDDEELVALALREQARTRAHAGDHAGADALLADAHRRFEQLGEPAEARRTDVVLAEVLLDTGRTTEAGEVLDRLVVGPDELSRLSPTLHRLIARHHLAEARYDEAGLMLRRGLEAAEQEADRYEEGLLLVELGTLASTKGTAGASVDEATRRGHDILDSMSVLRAG